MASFQTHITVAGAASLAGAGVCVQSGLASEPQALLLLGMGTVAGILPDVDSDHSISIRMVFGLLSFATAVALMFALMGRQPLPVLLLLALLGVAVVRMVVYPAFAHMTVHRGLFHSVPAAVLAGLVTMLLGEGLLGWHAQFYRLAGLFVSGGYLLHLLLDEIYSVNLAGHRLKASFGSALTVFSLREWQGYVLLYAAVLLGFVFLPHPPLHWPIA